MKEIMYFALLGLILFGCSEKMVSNQVIGNWWSIEDDSTYAEAYVNEDEWVVNHESYGPIRYEYILANDSLLISDSKNVRMRSWKIVKRSKYALVIKSDKEERKLYRLRLSNTYFEVINDSIAYEIFEQEFINRYLVRRIE
jgi:hypothetical protein